MADVTLSVGLLNQVSGQMNQLGRQIDDLHRRQENMLRAGQRNAKMMGDAYRGINASMATAVRGVTSFTRSTFDGFTNLIRVTARWGAITGGIAGGSIALLIRQGLKLNDEMERYRITLSTVMKSQAQANASIAWMIRFAEKTPFQVQGLVESTAQLEAFGINARKWLPILGDLSAAFGGSNATVNELVDALGKLKAGLTGVAFRSFRRFGISNEMMEQKGARFDKRGELVTPINEAMDSLEEIIRDRFGGMMEQLTKTYTGAMSNLADVSTNTLRDTMKPLFDSVRTSAFSLLKTLERMRDSGLMGVVTGRVGGAINQMYQGALGFAQRNIFDPIMAGQGIGAVFNNMLDAMKRPAIDFIQWFAKQFLDGLVFAMKAFLSSPEGRTLLGLGVGYKYGGQIIGAAGGAAGWMVGGGGAVAGGLGASRLAAGAGAIGSKLGAIGIAASTGLVLAQSAFASMNPGESGRISTDQVNWIGSAGAALANKSTFTPEYNRFLSAKTTNTKFANRRTLETVGSMGDTWKMAFGALQSTGTKDPTIMQVQSLVQDMMGDRASSDIQSMADQFVGLADAVGRFGKEARTNFLSVASQMNDALNELIKPFSTIDSQLLDINRSLGGFGIRIGSAFSAASSAAMRVSRGGDALGGRDAILAAYHEVARFRQQQFSLAQQRIVLDAKQSLPAIEANKTGLGGLIDSLNKGDPSKTANMFRDLGKAMDIEGLMGRGRSAGVGGMEILRLFKEFPGVISEKHGMDVFRDMALSGGIPGVSRRDAEGLFERIRQRGGTEFDTEALIKRLEDLTENFKLVSDEDVAIFEEWLGPNGIIMQTLPDAFESGAQAAINKLQLGMNVMMRENMSALVSEVVAETVRRLRGGGRVSRSSEESSGVGF